MPAGDPLTHTTPNPEALDTTPTGQVTRSGRAVTFPNADPGQRYGASLLPCTRAGRESWFRSEFQRAARSGSAAAGSESADGPTEKARADFLRFGYARTEWEYSREGAGPAAGILAPRPNATNGAFCVTRREAWATGVDCGVGGLFYRRYSTGPVASSRSG
jgi:hypothetical protein